MAEGAHLGVGEAGEQRGEAAEEEAIVEDGVAAPQGHRCHHGPKRGPKTAPRPRGEGQGVVGGVLGGDTGAERGHEGMRRRGWTGGKWGRKGRKWGWKETK